MAQVKRMNNGGSVQKLKYGRIIKNGTTYEMNEENIKRLEQHIAAADPDIQQSLANDWKLLMSGQDVTIDTMTNQRSTQPTDFSKGQMRRLGKDKSKESKWHSAFNTDIHNYNKATQYLGAFNPIVEINESEQKPEKIKLGPGSSAFEYSTNDDGTKAYRSLINTDEMKLFDDIAAYLNGDDNYRSGYDVTGWTDFKNIDSWYKNLTDKVGFMSGLRAKILQGQELTNDEKDYLIAIGLTQNIATNAKVEEQKESDELKTDKDNAWSAFNADGLWDNSIRDNQFIYDTVSGKYISNSNFKLPELPESTGYYFNDDFVDNYYGYDWLRNKVYFGGKWYKSDDLTNSESELYKMLNSKQYDYYNKNRRGDYAGADAVLKTYWNGYFRPTTDFKDSRLGSFYENENLRFDDKNYATKNTKYGNIDLDNSYNVHRIMDMSNEIGIDPIGRRPIYYTITDAYGNPVTLDGHVQMLNGLPVYDFDKFTGLYDGSTATDQTTKYVKRASSDKNNNSFYNRYVEENGPITAYIDPSDNNFVHLAIDKEWGGDGKNTFLDVPVSVYKLLTNKTFIEALNKNSAAKQFVSNLISGKANDFRARKELLDIFGADPQVASDFVNYFRNFYGHGYYAPKPNLKKGGVLKGEEGIPKLKLPTYEWGVSHNTPNYLQYNWNPSQIQSPGVTVTGAPIKFNETIETPTNKYSIGRTRMGSQLPKLDTLDWQNLGNRPFENATTEKPDTPELFGQNVNNDENGDLMTAEAVNQMFSLGRLGWDIGTNNKLYDIKAKGLIDASNAKMVSMPQEIYSRQTINAGNAERELGRRKLQSLPAINSDYISYAAMKRAAEDAANTHFANATLADSKQHSENLVRQTEEQRKYSEMRNQIEATNRGIQAAKMAGLSELRAARDYSNRQSFSNYMLEKQTEFDQNRSKMENALLAEQRLKWQNEAQSGYNENLISQFQGAYDKAADKGNYTLEQWVHLQPQHVNDLSAIKKRWQQYPIDQELIYSKSLIPGNKWFFKTGGRVRSASDQIRINKHKSFDQNWQDSNKAARKAIDKMNDRVHDILMKILS